MRLRRGDRVRRRNDPHVGTIVKIKERGVAGSAVTYFEWVEVEYDNGIIARGDPRLFEKIEND